MELTIKQENFARALSAVSRVASARTQLPILNNILLRVDGARLLIAATNLEIAATQFIGAKVTKAGSITVPAKLITEFVSNLPKDSIELKVNGNQLSIKSGHYNSLINGVIADEFPELPTIDESSSISYSITADDFKEAVAQTIITASSDTTRPVFTGVLWHSFDGHLYLAATDGYRLSQRRLVSTTSQIDAIIPVQTLQEVLRTLNDDVESVDILFDETQVRFRLNEAEIVSRLIDGNFPDYRKMIPDQNSIQAEIKKDDFMRITKIAGLFARESGGGVTLLCESAANKISIHSIASELGENTSEASAKVVGDGAVTLNSRYLTDGLNALSGDEVCFEFSGKLAPTVLHNNQADPDYIHIIMPLKS